MSDEGVAKGTQTGQVLRKSGDKSVFLTCVDTPKAWFFDRSQIFQEDPDPGYLSLLSLVPRDELENCVDEFFGFDWFGEV